MASVALLAIALGATSAVEVEQLKTEYLNSPLGLDTTSPRFSWAISSVGRGLVQQSYRIVVSKVGAGTVWDSHEVVTAVTHNIKYAGSPLKSGGSYSWSVRVTSSDGINSSAAATFSMGILAKADWSARFIGMASADEEQAVAPWFRKVFGVPPASLWEGQSALLHVSPVGSEPSYQSDLNLLCDCSGRPETEMFWF